MHIFRRLSEAYLLGWASLFFFSFFFYTLIHISVKIEFFLVCMEIRNTV